MNGSDSFVKDLLDRIRIMKVTGEILFRVEPTSCDRERHEGFTLTNVSST